MINRDEWLAALKNAECEHDDNAITSSDVAIMLGIGTSAAKVRIRKLVADGKAVAVRKHIKDGTGRTQSVAAYRLIK